MLMHIQYSFFVADTCLATADLAINCEPAADDTCPAGKNIDTHIYCIEKYIVLKCSFLT